MIWGTPKKHESEKTYSCRNETRGLAPEVAPADDDIEAPPSSRRRLQLEIGASPWLSRHADGLAALAELEGWLRAKDHAAEEE